MILTLFARKHAKRMCPKIDNVLERFTLERMVLDLFDDIRNREYMIFLDYRRMIFLNVPFLPMLCDYKKITPIIALKLIKQELVTYDNLTTIFEIYG